jgi:SAM-dependent methyltransferase
VLTVDFARLPITPGERVLDLGCGFGRHAFEAFRRGADVVAVDRSADEVAEVTKMFGAMVAAGEAAPSQLARAVRADLTALPFPDGAFDTVIASEVLEHIPNDADAIAEIARVVRPGGRVAVTVPRWWPERVCWTLSESYRTEPGGHVRIYTADGLAERLTDAGLAVTGRHHAHALHSPYWWINCAIGRESLPARAYHRILVWDIVKRPWLTRTLEHTLNPVLGKSLVLYADKPAGAASGAVDAAA